MVVCKSNPKQMHVQVSAFGILFLCTIDMLMAKVIPSSWLGSNLTFFKRTMKQINVHLAW